MGKVAVLWLKIVGLGLAILSHKTATLPAYECISQHKLRFWTHAMSWLAVWLVGELGHDVLPMYLMLRNWKRLKLKHGTASAAWHDDDACVFVWKLTVRKENKLQQHPLSHGFYAWLHDLQQQW